MNEDLPLDQKSEDVDDLASEYRFDYRLASPNRFAARCPPGSRLVLLDPDIAPSFPDAEAVNAALRALINTAASPGS